MTSFRCYATNICSSRPAVIFILSDLAGSRIGRILSHARPKTDKIAINKCSLLRKRLITDFKKPVELRLRRMRIFAPGNRFRCFFKSAFLILPYGSSANICSQNIDGALNPCAANSYKQPSISCGPINIHNVDTQMRT